MVVTGDSSKQLMYIFVVLGFLFFPFWIIAAIIWAGRQKGGEK